MNYKSFILVGAIVSMSAFGVYHKGDTVPNLCWQDNNNQQVCLNDHASNIKVLLYNAGWCGPCNEEFEELASQVSKYDGKNVTFISLSCDGWDQGDTPDATFLNEWRDKHHIPFTVAASPEDCGRKFVSGHLYIPNVAILNGNNVLEYQAISPGVTKIFDQVDSLLDNH